MKPAPPKENSGPWHFLGALSRKEHRSMTIAYTRKKFHRAERLGLERLVVNPDDEHAARIVAKSAARRKDWRLALEGFLRLQAISPSDFVSRQIFRTAVYSAEWEQLEALCSSNPSLLSEPYNAEILDKKLSREDPVDVWHLLARLGEYAPLPANLTSSWVDTNAQGVVDLSTHPAPNGIVNAACSHGLVGPHWAIRSRNENTSSSGILQLCKEFGATAYFRWALSIDATLDMSHAQALREHLLELDDDAILSILEALTEMTSALYLLDQAVLPESFLLNHRDAVLSFEDRNLPHRLRTLLAQKEASTALDLVKKFGPHLSPSTDVNLIAAIAEVFLVNGYHEEARSLTSRLVLLHPTETKYAEVHLRTYSDLRLHEESLVPGEIVAHSRSAAASSIEAHADNLIILDRHEMAESLLQPVKKLNRRGLRQRMHYRYYVLEDYEAVIQHHDTMILTNQRNSEFACHCALAHAHLGRVDEALAVLEHLTEAGEANACFTAFDILRREGRKVEALAMINRSMEHYGFSPIVKEWAKADFDLLHLGAEPVEPHHDERLVTVIMTAHKDNPMMGKAVTSILEQSYVNLELLIIDDASAKEDVEVYEAFEASDERIRILRMSENSGTYAGKNHGLKHAKGEFITFMDSDDWQHPQKIEKIIARLDKDPHSVAGFESYVRLMPDGELAQIGSWFVRKCLMGTVWKRQHLLEALGGFDEVRVSADSELLERAELMFGKERIIHTPVASYIATYHRQSLTGGGPFSIGWRGVRGARGQYVANFRAWHARNQNSVEELAIRTEDTGGRFPVPDEMPRARHGHAVMPIARETFDWVPKAWLNLQPQPADVQGQSGPITVCMATFPARFKQIPEAVASLLEQSLTPDRILIYVNEANEVPGLPDDPRIEVHGSSDVNMTDIGKFEVASMVEDGIVLTVDDDIWYPPNYVEDMVAAVQRYGGKAIIGVHGCVLPVGPAVSTWDEYRENRRVHWFQRAVSTDLPVNIVGTGTMAYDARHVRFDHRTYETGRMVDIHVAVEAQQKGYPMITPPRLREWMVPIEPDEGDSAESIWDMVRTDETMQAEIIGRLNDVKSWSLHVPNVGNYDEAAVQIFHR